LQRSFDANYQYANLMPHKTNTDGDGATNDGPIDSIIKALSLMMQHGKSSREGMHGKEKKDKA